MDFTGKGWMGCTVIPITSFPYDGGGACPYNQAKLAELRDKVKDLKPANCAGSSWLAVVNNSQLEAKKALEEAGFEELGRVFSSHDVSKTRVNAWIKGGKKTGEMCYLMGKGFYHAKEKA